MEWQEKWETNGYEIENSNWTDKNGGWRKKEKPKFFFKQKKGASKMNGMVYALFNRK